MATQHIEALAAMLILILANYFPEEQSFQITATPITPTSPSAKDCEAPIFYQVLTASNAKGVAFFTILIATPIAWPQAATPDSQKTLQTRCVTILRCHWARHTPGDSRPPVVGAVVVGDELRLCWDLSVPGTPGLKRMIENVMGQKLDEHSRIMHAHSRDWAFVGALLKEVKDFLKPWISSGRVDDRVENGDEEGITAELADAYLETLEAGVIRQM
ncbi:hypothetical protein ASPACDRAFT_43756 [Aspergillus aculeatus ATCC 16872]|uniref:Uncharacterized protein n=1 Tax=Aspergillus aculeatus (strain ATCC 16872 / CBS 172.66 / WB 5094) TaxID=690307 RepID=A0A1L9WSB9_ASPA1|nr:uncharacterized protein ASPACDRAFT_43756 [Aspergillus aculeatus ATCC 16872]OJJ99096.1 hypothetical protein ASPACDRAFT_43756 [Aspergillus aculeatus ATCC 16872]